MPKDDYAKARAQADEILERAEQNKQARSKSKAGRQAKRKKQSERVGPRRARRKPTRVFNWSENFPEPELELQPDGSTTRPIRLTPKPMFFEQSG